MTNNNPESQQECCEKCRYPENGDLGQEFWSCSNSDCPCHTPAPTQSVGWEEEFDKQFVGDVMYNSSTDGDKRIDYLRGLKFGIKDFIRSLLASARADERERVVGDVRNYFERWRRNKSKKFESAVNSEAEARAVEMFLDLVKELDKAKTRVTHALEAGLQEGVNK